MESEPQPEPVPLGVVNKMLEKELSVRENRLRCVECGNFQPVPDVEPEAPEVEATEDGEEPEAPVGPTCESCGSQRLNLIEQIQYEHKLALDHVHLLSKIGPKESKAIMDLPTNAPRTKDVFKRFKRGGTQLGDLDKDGKMSGYEKVRQKAIEKSMAAQRKK